MENITQLLDKLADHGHRSAAGKVDALTRLWLLRLLVPLGGYRRFVRERGFGDDEIAEYRIHDIVSALKDKGFKISLTTNGQLLDLYAKKLNLAGLSLIRTSWHSIDPIVYQEISGGYGDYRRFMSGVIRRLTRGSRSLSTGYSSRDTRDDIPEQLSFIERYRSCLKLYTLLWTPESASTYELFHQDWRPVVRSAIIPRTRKIERVKKLIGRQRIRFHLVDGGLVEVKKYEISHFESPQNGQVNSLISLSFVLSFLSFHLLPQLLQFY